MWQTNEPPKADKPVMLITGGSRGIGAAIVEQATLCGYHVEAPMRQVCDISKLASVERYAQWVTDTFPSLDVLVLNAGTWPPATPTYKEFELQAKYTATHWQLMHRLLNAFPIENVIAIASMRAIIGGVGCAPYAAAKAGLVALMLGYAREHGKETCFNAVCPGWTDTEMGREVKATGGVSNPNAEAQNPSWVASSVMRLVRDGSANGRVVVINQMKEEEWAWTQLLA